MAGARPLQQVPPRSDSSRRIARVKFAAFGPGPKEQPTKPSRELTAGQAELEPHSHGVMVHGKYLVPWANIYFVEFES